MKLRKAKTIVTEHVRLTDELAAIADKVSEASAEIVAFHERRNAASEKILNARERIVELESLIEAERAKEAQARGETQTLSGLIAGVEARRSKDLEREKEFLGKLPDPQLLAEARARIDKPPAAKPEEPKAGTVNVSPIKIGLRLKADRGPGLGRNLASASGARKRALFHSHGKG
jgi:chromosome segregation ATPase